MIEKLRVLVIAYAFPPASPIGTMRPLRLVRRLHAESATTTVLMGSPRTYRSGMPLDPALMDKVPPGVKVLQVPTLGGGWWRRKRTKRASNAKGSGVELRPEARDISIGRSLLQWIHSIVANLTSVPDREIGWILPAVLVGLVRVLRNRPDVIYSTAPPWSSHLVALGVARVTRVPWVADFRDPWARAPWRDDRPQLSRRAVVHLERWVIKKADAVIFATRSNCAEYASHYGANLGQKFHFVPNGCDPAEFRVGVSPKPDGPFIILHAGSLYGARSPVPLFQAVATMIRRGRINKEHLRLRFVGATGGNDDFDRAASAAGLDGVVEFVPRMPRHDIVHEMATASCLLVLQPGTTMSIPGKLYEYFAIGKPILALSEEGELTDLVRESGIGIAVTLDDEAGLVTALEQLMTFRSDTTAPPPARLYDGDTSAAEAVGIIRRVAVTRQGATPELAGHDTALHDRNKTR